MNKQELTGALSHIHASDNLKQEVLTMKSKSKPNFRLIAKRAAVCAAVLIIMLSVMLWRNLFDNVYTEQNVLKVYACDINSLENGEVKEATLLNGIDTSPWHCLCDPGFSANTYLPFTFSFSEDYYPGEEITFDIYADFADLWRYTRDGDPDVLGGLDSERFGKYATISNNSTILWECNDADQLEEIVGDQGFFYISIIIRADGQIVGYGLITLQLSTDPVRTATAVQCTTVSFPAVDGKKQSVSESYVWLQIEQLKKK